MSTGPGRASVDSSGRYLCSDPGLVPIRAFSSLNPPVTRRKREMIPADQKDAFYWVKRRKNNEAARRSREKRRLKDLMLEGHVLALSQENANLRAQMLNLQYYSIMEKSKYAHGDASAAATSVRTPTLPQDHSSALLQPGLWSSAAASEAVGHPPNPARSIFNPILPVLSAPEEAVESRRRSVEADVDAQKQVSSSDDISTNPPSHLLSSFPVFLPSPDALRHVSTLPGPSPSWFLPHLNYSNDLVLPWGSPYLVPPPLHLHIQDKFGDSNRIV